MALGNMYRYGRGRSQDARESFRFYRLAADQGDNRGKAVLNAQKILESKSKNTVRFFLKYREKLASMGAGKMTKAEIEILTQNDENTRKITFING